MVQAVDHFVEKGQKNVEVPCTILRKAQSASANKGLVTDVFWGYMYCI